MNYEPIFPRLIDSSMIAAYRSCPRKFYYEHVIGLAPKRKSIHLHAGGCFAQGIESARKAVFLEDATLDQAKHRAIHDMIRFWGDYTPPNKAAKTLPNMCAALVGYLDKWPPREDHIQPAVADGKPAVEFTFGIPLEIPHPVTGEPIIYAGRFDMLGILNGSIPCIVDEKTTSSISDGWPRQWTLRGQFIGYCWAASYYGLKVSWGVIRGIAIQKTKFVYAEVTLSFTEDLMKRWYVELLRTVNSMVKDWNEGHFSYNFGDACSSYGGCDMIDLCASTAPENWYDDFAIRRWNPIAKDSTGAPA